MRRGGRGEGDRCVPNVPTQWQVAVETRTFVISSSVLTMYNNFRQNHCRRFAAIISISICNRCRIRVISALIPRNSMEVATRDYHDNGADSFSAMRYDRLIDSKGIFVASFCGWRTIVEWKWRTSSKLRNEYDNLNLITLMPFIIIIVLVHRVSDRPHNFNRFRAHTDNGHDCSRNKIASVVRSLNRL